MGFWNIFYKIFPGDWFKGIQIRTYTALMLVNAIKIRRRDRTLRKASNRLTTRYTPQAIEELNKKYLGAKNPQKFQNKLSQFISNFLTDYNTFQAYYLDVLRLISQSLLGNKRQGSKDFTGIEALFAELERKKSDLIFPPGAVQAFRGKLSEVLGDLIKDIRMDERSDILVGRGSYPAHISFFSFLSPVRWWSRRKIVRKEKKAVKRLGKDLAFYDQIYARINQELQTGVRQDFLFLLIEFFKRVDLADKRLEEIKQDLELILKKIWDDVENVKKSLSNILLLLRNEPQIKNNPAFGKISENIQQLEATFKEIIKQDFRNTEALRKMLEEVLKEGNVIMAEMEEQSLKVAA